MYASDPKAIPWVRGQSALRTYHSGYLLSHQRTITSKLVFSFMKGALKNGLHFEFLDQIILELISWFLQKECANLNYLNI